TRGRPGGRRLVEPSPGDWALQGAGGRAAELVDGVGRVRIQRLPWAELTVLLAATMLRTLLWLPILYQLRKLLGALRAGRPYVRENANRLRQPAGGGAAVRAGEPHPAAQAGRERDPGPAGAGGHPLRRGPVRGRAVPAAGPAAGPGGRPAHRRASRGGCAA